MTPVRSRLQAFLPFSLFARTALILLVGLLATQSLSLWLHWGERATVVSEARGLNFVDRIADAVRRLEADPVPGHPQAIEALRPEGIRVTLLSRDQISPNAPRGQIQQTLAARLGSEREIRSPGGMGGGPGAGMGMGIGSGSGKRGGTGMGHAPMENAMRSLDIRLNDGQWVRIAASLNPTPPALPSNFYFHLLISLAVIGAVIMFAVRQATNPLKQLAQAADTFGKNLDAPPLAETGATELRTAAQAFNRMRDKIKRLIDERSRALAAVSHDLRTPLTRLRLRSELIEDERLRTQMTNDLDDMARMLDVTLDYLRGIRENEAPRLIDINALLSSLVEDYVAVGKDIAVEGMALSPYTGRLSALRRALQNLIDNALKYGRTPCMRVIDDTGTLRLIVEDSGPGLPPESLARITEPYYRPDAARASNTGGVGLGLSIVKDVALLHHGELVLANRDQGGLSATLVLPRNATIPTHNP